MTIMTKIGNLILRKPNIIIEDGIMINLFEKITEKRRKKKICLDRAL